MIKWLKNLFSTGYIKRRKPEIEKEVCTNCKGIGYHSGIGSDYQRSTYWCECKRIDGKFPGECYTIDIRWETSYHTIAIHCDEPLKMPDPKDIFEPYIKVYGHDGKRITFRTCYKKFLLFDEKHAVGKKVSWISLDSFYDEKEYSDIVQIIREEKLKKLGI